MTAVWRQLGEAYAENADLRRRVDELQKVLDERDLMEQAKGVIMGRLDIEGDDAFGVLQEGAGGDLVKLRLAAAAVVGMRRTPAEIAASLLREA